MGLDHIGKYRLLGKIGEGAMGEVYRAHDPFLNRKVAIKTIAPALGADPDFRHRFQREAQAAAQLIHPNIITVFEFGQEDGITYMAMELLEGKDLRDALAAGHLGPLREKLAVMQQVCDGVGVAHSKGVVHRDLKPGNIHIQPNGQVKVLDFGLARLGASDMTRTGTVMGTPYYMSPEQVKGQKADARSDVFALGVVFYELLAGRRPFEAKAQHEILMKITGAEPEPLTRVAPDVPEPVAAIVHRALSKDVRRRFAHAGVMGEALRRAKQALPAGLLYDEARADFDDASTTMWNQDEATVITTAPAPAGVAGSSALDVAHAPADETHLIGTARPARTAVGAATRPAPATARWPLWVGAAVVVAAVGVGSWAWLRRPATTSLPPAEAAKEHVGILTEALVTSQVELARADLDNRDYEAAVDRAEQALALSPGSVEVQEVLGLARRTLRERDDAVEAARSAFASGDAEAATQALGRVLSLDPRHPVVAELSSALNERFRRQAEKARDEAREARAAADRLRATRQDSYRDGGRLEREAAALLHRGEFTGAAQKYVESRDAFERAQREARIALSTPPPRPISTPTVAPRTADAAPPATPLTQAPSASATPATRSATPRPTPAQVAPPTTTLAPAPPPAAAPPVALPAAAMSADAAVRQVIADYGRAIESQDVALFRSLKPDLSSDEEKRLREAFEAIKSQQVGITVRSVLLEGDRATVNVSRQDTINGRQMNPVEQTFRLARQGNTWRIQSIGR